MIWAKYLFTQLFSATEADEDSGILEVSHLNKSDPEDVFERMFDGDIRLLNKDLDYISVKDCMSMPLAPRSRIDLEGAKKFNQ